MTDFEALLTRWQSAGVLDEAAAGRIRAWESEQKRPSGLRWQGLVALILGAILLACGGLLFISAHWDRISPGTRFALALSLVAVFHLAGAFTRGSYRRLSTALHAVGTVSTGASIALVGQIFNLQEHWPAAVLLWALAALAGWILLRDEAQQTLALLLFPAWLFSEFSLAAQGHIGAEVYLGRFLVVWATLYLTVFLGSRRKVVQGILFVAAAIACFVGVVVLLGGWRLWSESQTYLPFETRVWGWACIAVLPLFIALFRFRKSMAPVAAAIIFSLALPWCMRTWTEYNSLRSEPNLASHALIAAFVLFMIWWGVRQASRALVNLGIAGFAIAVASFYYSDILDKVGRSLGLVGLGVLFLAGGWALEKARRGLMTGIGSGDASSKEAQ